MCEDIGAPGMVLGQHGCCDNNDRVFEHSLHPACSTLHYFMEAST